MPKRKLIMACLGLAVWFQLAPISGHAQQSAAEKEFAFAQQLDL